MHGHSVRASQFMIKFARTTFRSVQDGDGDEDEDGDGEKGGGEMYSGDLNSGNI